MNFQAGEVDANIPWRQRCVVCAFLSALAGDGGG